MKKRVVMLSSGNTIPLEKDEYDKTQLAMQRNTGRNIIMNDGGIIRTVNIEYVGIVDDEEKAPANIIAQLDTLKGTISEQAKVLAEQKTDLKKLKSDAAIHKIEQTDDAREIKGLAKKNDDLLNKIGIAEANLKAEKVKKSKSPVKK